MARKKTLDSLRIGFIGAGFLALIAVIPALVARYMGIPFFVSSFLGGTGLLAMRYSLLEVASMHG